ncbi:MAG: helix-turn-helix transcriptional regulator [Ruminococcaceae bacterium]|nr:helix-turn-helix transcriptional regulator [Oscillospiraceae bacterium]
MDFGSKIRNAREDQDLSQQQVAQMIPMNQSNYSKIERNLQEPSLFQLKRIIEILHLDAYDLLSLDRQAAVRNDSQRFLDGIIQLYHSIYPDQE